MNNEIRKTLADYATKIHALKDALADIQCQCETIKGEIETVGEEETEKFNNMPEGLQAGDKGQAMQEGADALESASSDLEDAINSIESAISNIETAAA